MSWLVNSVRIAVKVGASCHPALLPCRPALLVSASNALVFLKWIFSKLTDLEQSIDIKSPK